MTKQMRLFNHPAENKTPDADETKQKITTNFTVIDTKKAKEAETHSEMKWIEIEKIKISEKGSRRVFDEHALENLACSIREEGMHEPMVVGQDKDGAYFIMAGIRRYLAALKAGLKKVPCIVKEGEAIMVSLAENLMREELSFLEKAEAFLHAMQVTGLNQKELAARFGMSTTGVNDIMRLNDLPESIKDKCRDKKFALSPLLKIVRIKNEDKQLKAFEALENNISTGVGAKTPVNTALDEGEAKPKPQAPTDIFARKLASVINAAEKIENDAIGKQEAVEIIQAFQSLVVQLNRLGIIKIPNSGFYIAG
jgi:ParB family chromosome partitioning protein